MTASMVTADEIREYIGIDWGDTDFNTTIINIAYAASDLLEKYTRRKFPKAVYSEVFDTYRTRINNSHVFINNRFPTFWVKAKPIDLGQTLTVTYSPDRQFLATDDIAQTINSVPQYEVEAEEGKIHLAVDLGTLQRALKITYTGGWAVVTAGTAGAELDNMSAEAPAALKQAALVQIAHDFDAQRSMAINTISEQDDATGRTKAKIGGLVPEAMRYADDYKLVKLGF